MQALTEADRLVRALGASIVVTPVGIVLPPEIEAVAHAVVREAVTNAIKHALGARLEIHVAAEDATLVISARNAPAAAPSAIAATGSGLGIAGMRERVELAGGALAAGPDDDGGFSVGATFPLAST